MLLYLLVSVQPFLKPKEEKSANSKKWKAGLTHSTGTLGSIKARFCILRKRSLNKFPSGCDQTSQLSDVNNLTVPKTDLQTPQAVREIFAQLNVDSFPLHSVFSEPLAGQALLELLPNRSPLLLAQLFLRRRRPFERLP
jgi:hypothetical protein